MNDAFFLLILPTRTLTIHLGTHRQCAGLSLRGSCTSSADAAHLLQTIQQLLKRHPTHAWIDIQQLHKLSQLGHQAMLRATAASQEAGTQLHWCGLSAALRHELNASGLEVQLVLQPADSFEGPSFLLPTQFSSDLPPQA
jgi:anti-anti-sigma regulatory factor